MYIHVDIYVVPHVHTVLEFAFCRLVENFYNKNFPQYTIRRRSLLKFLLFEVLTLAYAFEAKAGVR